LAQFPSFSEFPVPTANSVPGCIAAGPDSALWFTESAEFANNIGRITTAGAVTEYPIPTINSGAACIATGPDGALWFTEQNSNKIGRITTAGAITEFPVPTANSQPVGITAGPDGALWFTEYAGNKIGRITTAGAFTEYPVPTTNAEPNAITAGPDGALWFTEFAGNKIGSIATSGGAPAEYTVPTAFSGPSGIAAGPDGALWFTEFDGNKIGRITTSGGTPAEYQVPTGGAGPLGITSGPDGALWFTENNGNNLGAITPNPVSVPVVVEFPVPDSPGSPNGISVGPDGALWFTDDGANSIFRTAIVATRPKLSIFTNSPLPDGSVGVIYNETLSATGGTPFYNWSVSAGALPTGLSLNSGNGLITGVPTVSGPFAFTVQVADDAGGLATKAFSLTIDANGVTDFPLTGSLGFGGITAGSDGALWFNDVVFGQPDTVQAGRITTAGQSSAFDITTCNCGSIGGITTGPDGALWMAAGTSLGRIATAGTPVNVYPAGNDNVQGITTGPDGNLWFTANPVTGSGTVGVMNTSGTVLASYPISGHSAPTNNYLGYITTGSDGALWFTESVGYIGRITTTGAITEYPVDAQPFAIVGGPDGNLWFTDFNGAIWRITTSGVTTAYPVPTPESSPSGIAVGPDGALWFTAFISNPELTVAGLIGRITTSGAISEYPIPDASVDVIPDGAITAGPDGALWFPLDVFEGDISKKASKTSPRSRLVKRQEGTFEYIGRLLPAPTLTSMNPSSGAFGFNVPVVLTGSSFVPGATTVNVGGSGEGLVTVTNVTVVSPTQITATFEIPSSLGLTTFPVTVTTSSGTSAPLTFTVTAPPPPPSLLSISPASGVEGTSVPVVLTGANFTTGPTIIGTNFVDNYNQLVPLTPNPTPVDNGQLTVTSTVFPDPTDPTSQWVDFNFQSVSGGSLASNPNGFWQVYLTDIPETLPGAFTGLQFYWTTNGVAAPNITPITGEPPVATNLINPSLGLVYGSTFSGGSPISQLNVFVDLSGYANALQSGSMNPATINGFHIAARTTGGVFGPAVSTGNPGVTVSNLNQVSATEITAVFNIAPNAALGPGTVTVSTPQGTSLSTIPVTFTVLPPAPTLLSISPPAGTVGTAVGVTLTGTNFVTGGTTVNVTGGVTVSNVVVTSGTQLTATFTIPASATPGPVSVSVSTAGGTSGSVVFTLNEGLTITTTSPLPNGTVGVFYSQGITATGGTSPYVWAQIAGSLPAGLSLDSGSCFFGPTPNRARAVRPRQSSVCLIVGTPTTFGTSNFAMQVTDASKATATAPFSLTINPLPPTLLSINPATGVQGTAVPITLTGTNFVAGASVTVGNPGVTVSNVVVASASQITATFTIAGGATLGATNVEVTTSGGTSSPVVFTVLPPTPVLTSISPSAGTVGRNIAVTLTGSNFVPGATVNVTGGVTVSNVTVVSASQITATFAIPSTATPGPVNVTLGTAGGTSGAVVFTIDPGLTITTASPLPTGTVGTAYSQGVSLSGGTSPYTWAVTTGSLPAGLSLDPTTCTDPPGHSMNPRNATRANSGPLRSRQTTATTCLIVGTPTTFGTSNFTLQVTDASGAIASNPFALTINPLPPAILSINPPTGVQGTTVPVTITGTNFVTGASVAVNNSGVTVSNVLVASTSQITATFTIASSATLGAANVTVTTSGGTSSPVVFTILPPAPVLTSISPSKGVVGMSVGVTLGGSNFVSGSTTVSVTGGVTVSNVVVVSATQLTATFAISSGATLGAANVTVTTAGGTSSPVVFTILPQTPVLTSISPATGVVGTSVGVTLTGANFVSGGTTVSVTGGVTVSNVVVASATQLTATFAISSSATLGGASVTVTTAGGTSSPVVFTILPPTPVLTSVSPSKGVVGTSVGVTLIGSNFVSGSTTVSVTGGVTVSNGVVVSATQLTATVAISGGATLGAANVTVATAGGTSSPVVFTILPPTPVLTSVSPVTGVVGTSVGVTLTGANFVPGSTTVSVTGGVTVSNVVVASATQLTATFAISSSATLGGASITVTTAGGTSSPVVFTILPPTPVLTSISPAAGTAGTSVSVTLSGSNFVAGSTTVAVTGGVTVGNVTVASASQLSATLAIPAAAAPSVVNVTVSTAGGTSGTVGFKIDAVPTITTAAVLPNGTTGVAYSQGITVSGGTPPYTWTVSQGSLPAGLSLDSASCNQSLATVCLITGTPITSGATPFTLQVVDASGARTSAPFALTIKPSLGTITSISPVSGVQGTTVPVTINGTNFAQGATVTVTNSTNNAGVTVSNVVVASATQIDATFTIASGAPLGPDNVTVSTSAGATPPAVFTVLPAAPVLTSITPAIGAVGTSVTVTLAGNNFVAGATVQVSVNGVTATNVSVTSATQITATLVIASSAAIGPANVAVTTPGGTSGSAVFTITSLALTSISPANGAQGASVQVTLTGAGFVAGAQVVSSSSNVTVSKVSVVSATQIMATLNIAATASPGPVNITVTAGGLNSPAVTFTVGPLQPVLMSIAPASGAQGANVAVTLTGTGFATGDTIVIPGNSGITASGVKVVGSTQIMATFAIAANAPLGTVNIAVSGPGASVAFVPASVPFTVLAPLTLQTLSPAIGAQGTTVQVTLTGTGFATGATVSVNNPGVTVSNVMATSTQITATLTISATAATGPANLTVTVGGATSAPLTFTVSSPAPTVTAISAASIPQGSSATVTLTGTNFTTAVTITSTNPGVTASDIVLTGSTQISATLTIAAGAATGPTSIIVSLPGVGSAAIGINIDPAIVFSLTGLPASITPNQQVSLTVSISQNATTDVNGVLTIQFKPNGSLPNDQTFTVTGGTCTVAGTCTVPFEIQKGTATSATIMLQPGSVAGTLAFSIGDVSYGGATVTLSNNPATSVPAPSDVPVISSISITQSASSFNVVVNGLSNTLAITEADFTFTPASGDQLQTGSFSLTDVASIFASYYTAAPVTGVLPAGSQFIYTQTFNLTAGSIGTLQSVTVTLKNSVGASTSVTQTF
jgi:streptogramin lyase